MASGACCPRTSAHTRPRNWCGRQKISTSASCRGLASGYRRHSEALPVIGAIQKRFRLSAPFRSASGYRRHSEAVPVIGAIQKRFRLSAPFRSGSGYRRHSEALPVIGGIQKRFRLSAAFRSARSKAEPEDEQGGRQRFGHRRQPEPHDSATEEEEGAGDGASGDLDGLLHVRDGDDIGWQFDSGQVLDVLVLLPAARPASAPGAHELVTGMCVTSDLIKTRQSLHPSDASRPLRRSHRAARARARARAWARA